MIVWKGSFGFGLLVGLSYWLSLVGFCQALLPASEMLALKALYDATNGPRWAGTEIRNFNDSKRIDGILESKAVYHSTPWNFQQNSAKHFIHDPCLEKWYGIDCDATQSTVTQLAVTHMGEDVKGGLPPEIFSDLPMLKILVIHTNWCCTTTPYSKIPSTFGKNLIYLEYLYLGFTMAEAKFEELSFLGNMKSLKMCIMKGNFFQGDLAFFFDKLSSFPSLFHLNMGSQFYGLGDLPTNIGNLRSLVMLNFWEAGITGTLPSELNRLSKLVVFDIGNNGHEASQWSLGINENKEGHLHGPVPPLDNLKKLKYLNLGNNFFSGPWPMGLTAMKDLVALDLHNNTFGPCTIPSMIGTLTSLMLLALSSNAFFGTLPSTIGSLSYLEYLYTFGNSFTGSLPTSFGNLKQLKLLISGTNRHTGPIPDLWKGMNQLEYLSLARNKLTGTIPKFLGSFSKLLSLDLSYNSFIGSIPSSLSLLKSSLQTLNLGRNQLTGTCPSGLSLLSNLQFLVLSSNQFAGDSRDWRFINVTAQSKLELLDLSRNLFSGGIPQHLFGLSSLRQLFLSSNCFHGSLDERICKAKHLEKLVLDGMSSSSNCLQPFFPYPLKDSKDDDSLELSDRRANSLSFDFYFNGKFSKKYVGGSIPSCLWNLEKLHTLQLSGNGFTSSLPQQLNFSRSLSKLVLTHNKFTGLIPVNLFDRLDQFSLFDIGYNRFRGDLSAVRVSKDKKLIIRSNQNRLSGIIPKALVDLSPPAELDVLNGNLFSCPQNAIEFSLLSNTDSYSNEYQCGSMQFDRYFYCFIIICFLMLGIYYYYSSGAGGSVSPQTEPPLSLYHNKSNEAALFIPFLQEFFDLSSSWPALASIYKKASRKTSDLPETGRSRNSLLTSPVVMRFLSELDALKVYCQVMVVVFLVMYIPLYGVLSKYQSDVLNTYSYAVSAAFKVGNSATGILFTVWWLSIGINIFILTLSFGHKNKNNKEWDNYSMQISKSAKAIKAKVRSSYNAMRRIYLASRRQIKVSFKYTQLRLFIRLFLIMNINIWSSLIINSVFVYHIRDTSKAEQVMLKILLATYKLFSNLTLVPMSLKSRWLLLGLDRATVEKGGMLRGGDVFHSCLIIFNYIIAPCFALAMVDSSCFATIVDQPPGDIASYDLIKIVPFAYFSVKESSGGDWDVYPAGLDPEPLISRHHNKFYPRFIYSGQCSSQLIVVYTPVFLLTCMITALGPILKNWLWRKWLDAIRNLVFDERSDGVVDIIPSPSNEGLDGITLTDRQQSGHLSWKLSIDQPVVHQHQHQQQQHQHQHQQQQQEQKQQTQSASAPNICSPAWRKQWWDSWFIPKLWAFLIMTSPKGYLTPEEREWRDRQKLQKVIKQQLRISTFEEVHDSMVNVRSFYRQTLSDSVLLATFGTACPMLGIAVALAIYFRVVRWKRLLQSLTQMLDDEKAQSRNMRPVSVNTTLSALSQENVRGSLYNREEVTLLEEDILVANGGDKTSHPLYTSRIIVLILSVLFWMPFLFDIAESAWIALAFLLVTLIPFGLRRRKLTRLLFCRGKTVAVSGAAHVTSRVDSISSLQDDNTFNMNIEGDTVFSTKQDADTNNPMVEMVLKSSDYEFSEMESRITSIVPFEEHDTDAAKMEAKVETGNESRGENKRSSDFAVADASPRRHSVVEQTENPMASVRSKTFAKIEVENFTESS